MGDMVKRQRSTMHSGSGQVLWPARHVAGFAFSHLQEPDFICGSLFQSVLIFGTHFVKKHHASNRAFFPQLACAYQSDVKARI